MRPTLVVPLLLALAAPLRAQQPPGDSIVFSLLPTSRLEVRTGKTGLLGFAGHEHDIRARDFAGRVVYVPAAPEDSHVEITIATAGLEVLTPPDSEEIRKVTQVMRTDVLDAARYPEIRFASRAARLMPHGFHLVADLTMHGHTERIPVDVFVATTGDTLRAHATFSVAQTRFGITPYRGGPGGTVRVADRVDFTIDAVAVRTAQP